jgi:uncharacterized protein
MGLMHALRLDGWLNDLTGLGVTALDKTVSALHQASTRNADQYWEQLFHDDPMARRICAKVPDEMTRAGFELSMGDEENAHDIATAILDALRDLHAVNHIKVGMTWERAQGGAAVFIGADDTALDPVEPLNEARIRRITHLAAVDKDRIHARTWYGSEHPKAGLPETYWLRRIDGDREQGQMAIHESRLLIFPGGMVTHQKRVQLQGWGHSTLESVHDVLRDYNMSWRGLTHMLQSANQEVWKFRGFLSAMASGTEAMIAYFQKRLSLTHLSMGPNRPVILDSEGEGYERHASEFAGVPETIREMCQRVAAACDMPMTILFGMAPAGLNATGESDLQWWYETCAAMQVERLEPHLRRLITLLMLAKEGPTKGRLVKSWEIKFRPLKQMTAIEVASLRKTVAESDQIYIAAQVIGAEEVALARFRPEGWSMDTKIDLALRQAIVDADRAAAEAQRALTAGGAEKAQDTALNGAQVTALLEILKSVADGQLPRETGVRLIVTAFDVTEEEAEKLMGAVGAGFTPEPPAAPALPPGQQQPGAPSPTPNPEKPPDEPDPRPPNTE